jgi:hypothetical protein
LPQEQQFTPQEFAAKVKAKYPVYASIPDDQLVEKVTAKYPQYKASIKFSPESQRPDATKQAQAVIKNTPMTPSYSAMALANSPSGADPHNPGNPNLNAISPEMRTPVSTGLAATQAGILAGQGMGALAGKALGPTITSETVPTGIFGPNGEEIMREGMKYGPSAVSKALANPAAKKIFDWIGTGVLGTATIGGGWKALKALGIIK